MQVPHDGQVWPRPSHCVCLGREMVQVRDLAPPQPPGGEAPPPGAHLRLQQLRRDAREDRVGCVDPVLVGRVHRDRAGQRVVPADERLDGVGVVVWPHVESLEERAGVCGRPRRPDRAHEQPNRPAEPGQPGRHLPDHERRAAPGIEEQAHADPRPCGVSSLPDRRCDGAEHPPHRTHRRPVRPGAGQRSRTSTPADERPSACPQADAAQADAAQAGPVAFLTRRRGIGGKRTGTSHPVMSAPMLATPGPGVHKRGAYSDAHDAGPQGSSCGVE